MQVARFKEKTSLLIFLPGLFSYYKLRSKCSLRLSLYFPLQFSVVARKVPSCSQENSCEGSRLGNRPWRSPAKNSESSLQNFNSYQRYEGKTLHLFEVAQTLNIGSRERLHPEESSWDLSSQNLMVTILSSLTD